MGRRIAIATGCLAAAVVAALVFTLGDWRARSRERPLPRPGEELSRVEGASIRLVGSPGRQSTSWQGTTDFRGENVGVPAILARALGLNRTGDLPKGGLTWEVDIPLGQYNLRASAPTEAELQVRLRAALRQVFGIEGRIEKRPREVLVLVCPSGKPVGFASVLPQPPPTEYDYDPAKLELAFRGTFGDLARELGQRFHCMVIDETGLSGTFEASLAWSSDPGSTLLDVLRERGLELRRARRDVEVLVVREAR